MLRYVGFLQDYPQLRVVLYRSAKVSRFIKLFLGVDMCYFLLSSQTPNTYRGDIDFRERCELFEDGVFIELIRGGLSEQLDELLQIHSSILVLVNLCNHLVDRCARLGSLKKDLKIRFKFYGVIAER